MFSRAVERFAEPRVPAPLTPSLRSSQLDVGSRIAGGELPSTTVSRRHARISFDDDPWIEDLGSKNGTFVGENRITSRVRLNDGDRVRLGSFQLTFRVAQPPDATATQSTSDTPGVSKSHANRPAGGRASPRVITFGQPGFNT